MTAADNKRAIEETVAELVDGSQVASAVDPFQARAVSQDGTTAYATVTYKVAANDLTDAGKTRLEQAIDEARDPAHPYGPAPCPVRPGVLVSRRLGWSR
ncbi:hypothetical protein SSP24_52900 [Streptomyces spinoverrucosus]|uniref:Membrane transport protein MMPL domain-containing protein n=1 Tax=Streptomyces spinoverrucosus TaxID=284043 RepID=A0A4Y3VNF2_9ACTN|nr:hypothetical protein SSP24_52900 [Streptomyces spinoverrucosus]GHB62029.1 hypothetical protein GCM10010397_35140 [Streptomyces spinoverrucosus]